MGFDPNAEPLDRLGDGQLAEWGEKIAVKPRRRTAMIARGQVARRATDDHYWPVLFNARLDGWF